MMTTETKRLWIILLSLAGLQDCPKTANKQHQQQKCQNKVINPTLTAAKPVQRMRCHPECHITGMPGTCQTSQDPGRHSVSCPRACPVSPGRSRVSGARRAADAQEGERDKGDIVPSAPTAHRLGRWSSHLSFSQNLFIGGSYHHSFHTKKKNI